MRVAGFILFASGAIALGLTGCTSSDSVRPAADVSSAATSPSAALGAPTIGTKAEVCAAIRTEVAAHMRPLGTALGRYIGFRAAADPPDQRVAANAVRAELSALAGAISSAGAAADDPSLRDVTADAARALDGLSHDGTLLSVLAQMSDIPGALTRLTAVVQPVTDACS